ncbi:MAG TPA: DUF2867 domain-containing protein, partial [Steroidobacteraceae bacterium]
EQAIAAAIDADRNHTVLARWVEGALASRNFRPEYAYYAKRAGAMAAGDASPASVMAVVQAIGGDEGWYFADLLWNIRRGLDWLAGGPSIRRKRRHPEQLRVGDVIDSWRVIAHDPDGGRLTLRMEMKGPGAGMLEFVVKPGPAGRGSTVHSTAYWHPAGVPGLLYWYVLAPAHLFLFKGMTRAIQRRASALERAYSAASPRGLK